jgi:GNAT superfamily N-acetyltransferase
MRIVISKEPIAALAEYARVSIAFEVTQVLDITAPASGLGGLTLSERTLDVPYVKDYDAIEGEGPARWAKRFDISNWVIFAARLETRLVGGAVVAFDTPGLTMLEGRSDLAVLWDIRVSPEARGQGVGSALFRSVEAWAVAKGCRCLKVETQNINVPACRFYARQGCVLGGIHRFAYPELPDEVQLLWYKDLSRGDSTHAVGPRR